MSAIVRRALLVAAVVLLLHLALSVHDSALALRSLAHWGGGLSEVLAIVPSILVLIALFEAWVPKEVVEQGLGPRSGLRGVALALVLGTGAAGPLYAAFPIGISLREKGARTANLVIFLGAWASIKLPMLLLEGAFLGTRFALLRLALTLPGLIACGFLAEWLEAGPVTDPLLLARE